MNAVIRTIGIVGLLPLLSTCGGSEGGTGPDVDDAVASVTVSPASDTVYIGSTIQLTATVRNERGEIVSRRVSWSSSAPGIAAVSSGVVTGIAVGLAEISATASGRLGSAAITVRDLLPPAAPSNVRAVPFSDTEIDVSWDDNSTNEDGFVIEREAAAAPVPGTHTPPLLVFAEVGRVGANITFFRDTGLTPASTYRYPVVSG